MPDPDPNEWNRRIIEEFRGSAGKVGGNFEGAPMVLIHHKGAKTGKERVNPLVYLPVGDNFAIFASKGGAPNNPEWFHNLVAHPRTKIEVGTETIEVQARVLSGAERDEIWAEQKKLMPGFAEYEERSKDFRVIPVVLLQRVS
jgi:deazaflavin-dependent oxidoreductase (nitroreductase family)